MKALVRRRVNSRSEVAALSDVEQRQLIAAGQLVLGAEDLEGVLTWSDHELLGWLQVRVEHDDGTPLYDGWLLAHGDDGLLFAHGDATHLGIALSQTYLVDAQSSRKRLVEELQQALDCMPRPLFLGWVQDDVSQTVHEPLPRPDEVVDLELVLRKA